MLTYKNESFRHRHFDGNIKGNRAYLARVANIPNDEQAVPIIVVGEIIRGRFNRIRQAEAGKAGITLERAYQLFEQTLDGIREMKIISFSQPAELLVANWRINEIKGSTHDLRIAASCVVNSVTLVTRNRRDFESVPGLTVEFWE
jgi:tRNA(fMet)-specific endonuclease VapC